MSELNAYQYKGHSIEPLIYAKTLPRQGGTLRYQRYQAAVSVINLETRVKSTAKLPDDFDSFGAARRAAQERGEAMVNDPASVAQETA